MRNIIYLFSILSVSCQQFTGYSSNSPNIDTLSTKNYTSDTGNHFRVEEDTILYYNGKQFLLTNSIQELIGIINVPYRKEEMIENTSISKRWYWKKGALAYWYSEDDGSIRFFKSKEDYENVDISATEYSSEKEMIRAQGMYDSLYVKEYPEKVLSTFYIWDELGFNISTRGTSDTIARICIFPLPMRAIRSPFSKNKPNSQPKAIAAEKKDYEDYTRSLPKGAFKGKITYNGNTCDFSQLKATDWDKMVKQLGLEGAYYDDPGDSKQWSRRNRSYEVHITFNRMTNEGSIDYRSPDEVGSIDFVEKIIISK